MICYELPDTAVSMQLPKVNNRREARPNLKSRNGRASMPKVLLAEDDDGVREMLRVSLERDGFDVIAVANVCEALSRIATETFDVLLSDLHMPQAGDGFTVVSAMRHTHPRSFITRRTKSLTCKPI